jgi:hypothetical protein
MGYTSWQTTTERHLGLDHQRNSHTGHAAREEKCSLAFHAKQILNNSVLDKHDAAMLGDVDPDEDGPA